MTGSAKDYLERAANSGCLNLSWMEQDADLNPVRENLRFKEVITQFKAWFV